MILRVPLMMTAALLTMIAAPALGQSQAQLERLDTWARYTVTAPICERLGIALIPDAPNQIGRAVGNEAYSWNVDRLAVDQAISGAMARQTRMLQIDLGAASRAARTDQQLRDVRLIFLRYGRTCMEAAADPLFSQFLRVPPAYSLETAATAASDSLLEEGGLASWQTPLITARGDMLMLAGACRQHIGPARSDELRQSYARSDDARERAYYIRSFDRGLADTELRTFDKAQCERAIARYRQQIVALTPR